MKQLQLITFVLTAFCLKGISGLAVLGGSCASDTDCMVPWSYCLNRKCQCRPKYVRDTAYSCVPARYFCPVGPFNEPVKNKGQVLTCTIYTIQPVAATSTSCAKTRLDTCPTGSYCNPIQSSDSIASGTSRTGVCCSMPRAMCPTGEASVTYANGDCSGCPTSTHFCFCDALTNMAACCPRSCPNGQVYSSGACGTTSSSGSVVVTVPNVCNNNDDCSSDATCAKIPGQTNKQCVCTNGWTYTDGRCTNSLCANGDPAMTNNVVQTCSASASTCPANYQCDTSRGTGICCPTSSSGSSSDSGSGSGSGSGSTSTQCPDGQTTSGQTCTAANPACNGIGESCSAAGFCCKE